MVELLGCSDEAEVALLNEIEEKHPSADVALRDRHDETKIRLDELHLGVARIALHTLKEGQRFPTVSRAIRSPDRLSADAGVPESARRFELAISDVYDPSNDSTETLSIDSARRRDRGQ
jgi:hypothetical protein